VDAATQQGAVTPLFPDELVVLNKVDLVRNRSSLPASIPISCRTGEGIEALVAAILCKVTGRNAGEAAPDVTAINTRHRDCLRTAQGHLGAAIALLEAGEPPELVAVEVRSALGAVGEIVGEVGTEDILGKIFSSFCIGK
jgi:tRNA modification GTPase